MLSGTLLAESLRIGAVVAVPGLRLARLGRRDVSSSVAPGQPTVWTFIEFEADDDRADELTEALAEALLLEGGWYADFGVGHERVVVFAHRVFRYRRGDPVGRAEAEAYGRAVGVPEGQLDWPD